MKEVRINKDMKLSEHFTLGELTKTSYYTLDGNIPSRVAIENLKRVCGWLEILRERYNARYGVGVSPPEFLRPDGSKPAKLERGGVKRGAEQGNV